MKPAILACILLLTSVCFSQSENTYPEKDSTRSVSTSFTGKAFPIILEAAFTNGTRATEGNMHYVFHTTEIGKLKVKTGKLIACDPVNMHAAVPFVQSFPKGQYPVELALTTVDSAEIVAYSRILFSAQPVARWEFALLPGQQHIGLTDSAAYCYPVDAGTGMFVDASTCKIFSASNRWNEAFQTKAEQHNYSGGYMYDFGNDNLAAFFTGFGDGCYATYIGFDAQGNVCRLLTDFGLVEWWEQ